jgi:hypothetical protein
LPLARVQLLQQPFNPSGLPCGITVVGIGLGPETAENELGDDHTVTASLTDLVGNPQVGIEVSFAGLTGPNAGASGSCTVNVYCTTDANGEISFIYTGSGGEGIDEIGACFLNQAGVELSALPVTKEWIMLNAPPECADAYPSQALLWGPDHRFEPIEVLGFLDPDGEPVTITIASIRQHEPVAAQGTGTTAPDGRGIGTAVAEVRAERIGSDGKNARASNGRV